MASVPCTPPVLLDGYAVEDSAAVQHAYISKALAADFCRVGLVLHIYGQFFRNGTCGGFVPMVSWVWVTMTASTPSKILFTLIGSPTSGILAWLLNVPAKPFMECLGAKNGSIKNVCPAYSTLAVALRICWYESSAQAEKGCRAQNSGKNKLLEFHHVAP